MPAQSAAPTRAALADQYRSVRRHTLALAQPLSAEDQSLQSMPEASPAKWHQAHTSWFFETLVLGELAPGYTAFDASFRYLFNSYYESVGPRHPRPQRGLLSRPALAEVQAYRAHVDAGMLDYIEYADAQAWPAASALITLGLHHEQQHQELLLTDVLHAFSCNPLLPAYQSQPRPDAAVVALQWLVHAGGTVEVGHAGNGFAFDNESPRHATLLQPFEIANRLVSCGEYLAFIADGGYRNPAWWLSDGWALAQSQAWQQPPYWLAPGDARAPSTGWQVFGLDGVQPLDLNAPVMQLSYFEAAAFADWAGARLPTEFEWEAAAPMAGMRQLDDQAWQWTRSAYQPYPGFAAARGAVGEYNGKFMVGQQVLRGGSLATPAGHHRVSYRNFFPPAARWQFSGLRLARDPA